MDTQDRLIHLKKLAEDLYNEGYQCGISGDDSELWYAAWAEAMLRVASGDPYVDCMVIDAFRALKNTEAQG